MALSLFRDPFFDNWGMIPLRESREDYRRWNMLGSCDIVEKKGAHVFTMDTPGMKKEDVNIEVENNILTVSGERKSSLEQKDDKVHRVERHYGQFKRSFALPEDTDLSKIKAKFDSGTLCIEVPKSEQKKPKTTRIPIAN